MAHPLRHFLLLAILVAVAALTGGTRLSPAGPAHVTAAGVETFTQTAPTKVYAGVPSHYTGNPPVALTADANPSHGPIGYCVTVVNEGHASTGPNNGFSVTNGIILSSSFFNNGSATTTDDVYCVVVQANPPAEFPGRDYTNTPPMTVDWAYLDSGNVQHATLDVAVVYVRLVGRAGQQACTVGWDPTFLTGQQSMTPPVVPNPLDEVSGSDFNTNPGPPTIAVFGAVEVRTGTSVEWCANIFRLGGGTEPNVQVTFHFVAVYDINSATDDVYLTATTTMDITTPPAPELRHINAAGQIVLEEEAAPNVIGGVHTACIIPSVVTDPILTESNVVATSPDGATFEGFRSYHNPPDSSPGHIQGVPDGTVCFDWYSSTEGYQQIAVVNFVRNGNPTGNGPTNVKWDTSDPDNGNGFGPTFEGAPYLLKSWNRIDTTVISNTGAPDSGDVTNTTQTLGVAFNVANGTFLGFASYSEFVIGSRPGPGGTRISSPLDGVPVILTITGGCGYFAAPGPGFPGTTSVQAVTVAGHVTFTVKVDHDPGCTGNNLIHVTAQAYYPATVGGGAAGPVETLDIQLQFFTPTAVPVIAWAGQTVTITYAFSGTCPEATTYFSRSEGQPGTFLATGGIQVKAPDFATAGFIDCQSVVQYESEDPGEVDVVAQLPDNPYSKVHFPIFFIALEDFSITGPDKLTVSELGHIDGQVRGWFVNANPSGRPQEKKPDGRTVPADRWVLPDDWPLLKGPQDFNLAWPDAAVMPAARVTFLMQNEGVPNNFHTGVKNGALGFFLPDDGDEFALNIDPDSKRPSILGVNPDPNVPAILRDAFVEVGKPRIISELTDENGATDIDTFGDLNLSFEGCAANAPTGNPDCKPGDVVGHTTYYAVVDYPADPRGKFPPLRSNSLTTEFSWRGFKDVTVVDGPTDTVKYVVSHAQDRDGFCDAASYNNVLGVPVDFSIDAGDGIITGVEDQPSSIQELRRAARATTYDTRDDLGNPINQDLAKPTLADDECQSWVRVDNTLPTPANVRVTFSPPPAAVPGDLRITGLTCGNAGTVTVTNVGDNLVSLAGFSIRSLAGPPPDPEEYLGLQGHLAPGQSITIIGDAATGPWLNASNVVFGNVENDYARLVWEETTISYLSCIGESYNPPVPTFPQEAEGAIERDVVVNFGATTTPFAIVPGWNLVTAGSSAVDVADALGGDGDKVSVVYGWQADTQTWLRYIPGAPADVNNLTTLQPGQPYWVLATAPFTLSLPR